MSITVIQMMAIVDWPVFDNFFSTTQQPGPGGAGYDMAPSTPTAMFLRAARFINLAIHGFSLLSVYSRNVSHEFF